MRRLVAQADAVMHNMRGDAAARLGIDYETARELNPSIIYLYAGSYGSTGPGAGRAAFHPMMGALSGGALRQLGRGNEPPAADVPLDEEARYQYSQRMIRSNEASPDITGALGVATALSLGLLHRQRTGRGQYIETTMLASNLLLCSEDAIRYAGKPDLPQVDGDLRGTSALNRLYQTAAGWLFVCTPTEPEWRQLCATVDRAGWIDRCPVPDGRLAPALQRPARRRAGDGARSTARRRMGEAVRPGRRGRRPRRRQHRG